MKITWISTTLFLIVIIALPFAAPSQTITRGPYLQMQTPNSMNVVWLTDEACKSEVEWGPTASYGNVVSESDPATRHEVSITNLTPDTEYHYRVLSSGKPINDGVTFRTAPTTGSATLSFTVQGDSRSNPPQCKEVLDAMLPETKMGFCITLGDLPGRGEDNKTDYWQRHFFNPAKNFVDKVCVYPCIGNHEVYDENSYPKYVFPTKYLDVWSLPTASSGNEFYYSFDVADAHFVCLDVYWSDFEIGSDQYKWLVKDLAASTQKWKFVFMHNGPYVSQQGKLAGSEKIRENLSPVFEDQGVDLVMFGHYHDYQRNIVKGVNYLMQGTSGAGLGNKVDDNQPFVQAFASEFSFTRIDIDGDTLLGKTMKTDSTITDGFQISKTPEPLPLNESSPADSLDLNWIAPWNFDTQCGIAANPTSPSGDGYAFEVADTSGHQFAYPMLANESLTDYSIEADIYYDGSASVKNRFGIGLRGRLFFDPLKRSYYTLAYVNNDPLSDDGHCLLIQNEGTTETVLADWEFVDAPGWHKMKLSANADKLSVWIDGELKTLTPITTGDLPRGRPFIYNYRRSGGAKTIADRIVISNN